MPRRPQGGLAAWLRDAETPLYVVDARRVVLFFNRGCEQRTGWSAADVVGRTCDFASEPDGAQIEALTCALGPPPEAIAGRPVSIPVAIPTLSGQRLPQLALFLPLPTEDPAELRILCAWLPPQAQPAPHPALPQLSSLHAELALIRDSIRARFQLDQVVAQCPAMQRALEQVQLAAQTGIGVHLTGLPGTGREFLARVIHQQSPRRLQIFVPLDCSALTPFELKRTLVRALQRETQSDAPLLTPGTILLQNVSHMPRDVQQSLLDNWRWPTATAAQTPVLHSADTASLADAVEQERFIPELHYRLTALVIDVPPLRDRGDDLPLLTQFLIERCNQNADKQLSGFSADAFELLRQYHWPGQVRELQAVVEEAHAAATGPAIQTSDLPFRFRTGLDAQRSPLPRETPAIDLEALLQEIETREIRRALEQCRGNRAKAARLLGLTRTKLYRRMEHLGMD